MFEFESVITGIPQHMMAKLGNGISKSVGRRLIYQVGEDVNGLELEFGK